MAGNCCCPASLAIASLMLRGSDPWKQLCMVVASFFRTVLEQHMQNDALLIAG